MSKELQTLFQVVIKAL